MAWGAAAFPIIDLAVHELLLFAGTGFLLLGAGDLAVDAIWIVRAARHRLIARRRDGPADAESLPFTAAPGPLAVFVPAWDEAAVIGPMLRTALRTFDHPDWRIYVGCYPNDPATIAAVRGIADPRIRAAIGPTPGPTTKADCLNRLWEAMRADEASSGRRYRAVVLHDAEDVVHSAELRLFDALLGRFDLVQIPVLPLLDPGSRWIAGHYADEFAESHGKELVVRAALGAALPSAGVGCAISRDALEALASLQGAPFDPDSLTEDYELGLKLHALGRRSAFVRMPRAPGRPVVATREHFPGTLEGAVAQKARWMTGIALSGWDRLGWQGGVAERWMRLRDRQSLLFALLLLLGYLAGILWLVRTVAAGMPPLHGALALLLAANSGLLGWRLAVRFGFVAHAYGWKEGLRSIPRAFVGNFIALLAARRALQRYLAARSGAPPRWDKTAHIFPREMPAE